jgi:hypothetical protein
LTYTDSQGHDITVQGAVSLADAFFNPALFKQAGIDGILKFAASTQAEQFDNQLVGSLRNFLFGQPGQGGMDLASLNIQRGRDHGLADYNTVRAAYGLPRVHSFAEITSNVELQQKLRQLYGNVNNIDLWVGALAEDHPRGSSVGLLEQHIIADQFQRVRDGDRFWYQRVFSGQQLRQLEHTTLADIIERNTQVRTLQDNVFVFKAQVQGQVFYDHNGDRHLNRGDTNLRGILVQLLNNDGKVIGSARTDFAGRFSFRDFPETGDYRVRVTVPPGWSATTPTTRTFLISRGDSSVNGLNFGLHRTSAGNNRAAATLATTTRAGSSTLSHATSDSASDDTLLNARDQAIRDLFPA